MSESGLRLGRIAKVCAAGILLSIFARAGGSVPPRELLLRLQDTVNQGNLDGARRQLKAALRLFPSEPALYNLLGVVEVRTGNRQAAEANFLKAVSCAPDFNGARLNLGQLYLENSAGDPKAAVKALEAYQNVLRYERDNTEALYESAALLEAAGSYQASLDHLKRLPGEEQERAQALAVQCADFVGMNQPALANVVSDRLLKSPDLDQAHVMAILPRLEARDKALAVRLLEGLLERHRGDRAALVRLGWHYEQLERLDKARETLERAEQAGPPSVEILTGLARVAYRQQDRRGTLGYLAQARDLDPRNAGVHFFFGIVCVELNLPIEARKSLEEAVWLDPENAYYNYALGAVAVYGRDPAQAISYFERYAARKPDDPRGRFALGVAHFYVAEYEAAAENFRPIAGRQETAAGTHYFLGRIAKMQDNLPEAEAELKKALAADPRFTDALAELAHVHIRLERYDDARSELASASSIDPDNFRVNANLLILYQKTKDTHMAEQQARFEEIKRKRAEDEQLLWRTIEVRPY